MRIGTFLHHGVTASVAGLMGIFAPSAALNYRQNRERLLFAAARKDGANARWRPRDGKIDALIMRDRALVQARARELVRDNPNVSGALDKIANNVIFEGILPQVQLLNASDERDRKSSCELERIFKDWAEHVELVELETLVLRALWVDGGCLLHTFPQKKYAALGIVPLGVELLELDRLARHIHGKQDNGNVCLWGIEFDADGEIVAYHVKRENPATALTVNSGVSSYSLGETVRLSATECRMIMRKKQIGQTQGISWLISVIISMHDFDEYQTSERIAARLAAAFGVFVTTPSEEYGNTLDGLNNDGGTSPVVRHGSYLESGTIQYLPQGAKVEIAEYNRPGNSYEPFTRTSLRMSSAGIGMSAEAFSNDYTGASYSSVRQAVLEERRGYRVQQGLLIRLMLRPLWAQFCAMLPLYQGQSGLSSTVQALCRKGLPIPCRWQKPGWAWVDPTKDAQAAALRLQLSLTTRHELCAEAGLDFEDVLAELSEEQKALEAAGLCSDTKSTAKKAVEAINKSEQEEKSNEKDSKKKK